MTDSFRFKIADVEDIELVRALTLRAYEKWVAVTPRKPRPMTADYNESFATNRFDLLLDGDDLVDLGSGSIKLLI